MKTRSHKVKVVSKKKLIITYSRLLRVISIGGVTWQLWGIQRRVWPWNNTRHMYPPRVLNFGKGISLLKSIDLE
jgi:hypothetical protein